VGGGDTAWTTQFLCFNDVAKSPQLLKFCPKIFARKINTLFVIRSQRSSAFPKIISAHRLSCSGFPVFDKNFMKSVFVGFFDSISLAVQTNY
jgi:hypothetical protein